MARTLQITNITLVAIGSQTPPIDELSVIAHAMGQIPLQDRFAVLATPAVNSDPIAGTSA